MPPQPVRLASRSPSDKRNPADVDLDRHATSPFIATGVLHPNRETLLTADSVLLVDDAVAETVSRSFSMCGASRLGLRL